MTLEEIARQMAQELQLEIRGADAGGILLAGRNASMRVAPYFGGWQIDVDLPGRPRYQFFEEDIRMLVQRVGARLRAYECELAEEEARKKRPGR